MSDGRLVQGFIALFLLGLIAGSLAAANSKLERIANALETPHKPQGETE